MKKFFLLSFILIMLSSCVGDSYPILINIDEKALDALQYCQENNLNTEKCILIDMSIHSGENRLFIYNFNSKSVTGTGLCSHGCGDSQWGIDATKETPVFSNIAKSHCSSLGKYKIGKRGYSNWGIHVNYKLHGLETSNSNALSRDIVLHSWKMVPNHEIFPNGTPEGWGCPAVSNEQMKFIDELIQSSGLPMLLWIYKK